MQSPTTLCFQLVDVECPRTPVNRPTSDGSISSTAVLSRVEALHPGPMRSFVLPSSSVEIVSINYYQQSLLLQRLAVKGRRSEGKNLSSRGRCDRRTVRAGLRFFGVATTSNGDLRWKIAAISVSNRVELHRLVQIARWCSTILRKSAHETLELLGTEVGQACRSAMSAPMIASAAFICWRPRRVGTTSFARRSAGSGLRSTYPERLRGRRQSTPTTCLSCPDDFARSVAPPPLLWRR